MNADRAQAENRPVMITVIVPVYNSSGFLRRCLEAVTASDYPSYQCIVVNDGSTDDSGAVARRFPVEVMELAGGPFGPAYARNRGAEAAKGEILFFVDADVVIYPDTLSKMAETFARRPDADAVFGSYDESPDAEVFVSQYKNLFHHFVHQQGREEATTFWAGCGAVRRGVFYKLGGYDQDLYARPSIEDIELGYRLRAAGHTILLIRDIQAKHLKRWTLRGLIKADVFDRGIPWTLLSLRNGGLPNDLNLRFSQRLSALLLCLMLLYLGVGILFYPSAAILPLLVGLFFLVVGHWSGGDLSLEMSRRAGGLTAILGGTIAGLALYWSIPWFLGSLAVVLLGWFARRGLPHASELWTHGSFVAVVLGFAAGFAHLLIDFPLWLTAPLLFCLLSIVLMNHQFYSFFTRQRGAIFALAVVPFHLLYYLYSVLAFVLGTGLHIWNTRVKGVSRPVGLEP